MEEGAGSGVGNDLAKGTGENRVAWKWDCPEKVDTWLTAQAAFKRAAASSNWFGLT